MNQRYGPKPRDPLVDRSDFRGRAAASRPIPSFAEQRARLPEPIFPDQPAWVEMYWRAWELAWGNLHKPPPGTGLVANFLSCPGCEYLSAWQAGLCALYGVYGRRAYPFISALDNFYARQHDDGYLPGRLGRQDGKEPYGAFDPNGPSPSILAWVEWSVYRQVGDQERLAQVFWPLLAHRRWLQAQRTWPNGLYWATGLSSGMPNQERVPGGTYHHAHWTWVDANMQAAVEQRCLAQMAMTLGEADLSATLNEEAAALAASINATLWDRDSDFYKDRGPGGQFGQARSAGAYWSLLDKDLVPPDRLVEFLRPLRDESAFLRTHRVPSLAADSPGYAGPLGDFWRGGVWSPLNYMLLKGLRRAGQRRLAHQIAMNHLEQVTEVFLHTDTLWEYYAPDETVAGSRARPDFVGWTGLSPISILLEDVMGLSVDWPLKRVTWDLQYALEKPLGVRNYPLGSVDRADLIADANGVVVDTKTPFNLTVWYQDQTLQVAVPAGRTELPF